MQPRSLAHLWSRSVPCYGGLNDYLKSDDLIDVISYLLKSSGCFWSEDENLTFGESDIDILQNKIENLEYLNPIDKK